MGIFKTPEQKQKSINNFGKRFQDASNLKKTGMIVGHPWKTKRLLADTLAKNRQFTADNEGLVREISECRKTLEKLHAGEKKFRQLVENVNDVIFQTDEQGRIVYFSPSLERMLEYLPSEIEGKLFTDFLHPDDLQNVLQSFHKTLEGKLETSEFRIRAKDGAYRHVRTSSRPMNGGTELTGIMVDLTECKRLDAELEKTLAELKKTIKVKDRFVGILAHDMKNPIHTVMGLSDLLASDIESLSAGEITDFAVEIGKKTTRLYTLLENLLK